MQLRDEDERKNWSYNRRRKKLVNMEKLGCVTVMDWTLTLFKLIKVCV